MPRVRRYTRVVKPKQKWGSHLFNFNSSVNSDYLNVELAKNADSTQTPITSLIKCGNFKVNLSIRITMTQATTLGFDITIAIIYIPEGVAISTASAVNDILMKHPEWVMAIKFKSFKPDTASAMNMANLEVSSRLKRNLNSGDRIALVAFSNGTQISQIGMGGVVRFWTRYN